MSGCAFPEHHKTGRSGAGWLVVVALVVVVYLAVQLALAVVHFVTAWWWTVAAAAAVVVVALVVARIFGRHLPPWLRYLPLALWAMLTWRAMCRRLALISHDRRTRSGRKPRWSHHPLALVYPARHGITIRARTVAGVDREAIEKQAEHFRNHWRCGRVTVVQPRPGRLELRGLRADPLTGPLGVSVLPAFDGRHITLGRDERGQMRIVDLANISGSAWSGAPGRGKTEAALSLAVQLAASPLVDWWILDGGACDWEPFADGVAGYVGDDLAAAEDMLRLLDVKMCDRRRTLAADLGVRNGWAAGPTRDYRLQWLLVEEAPFYLDLDAVKGDRTREAHVRACRGLLAGLLRRGRAPLFHTSLVTQKPTNGGGLPVDLRDLTGLRWSFGLSTTEQAVGILGDDIRRHETKSPTLLQSSEHVGVASVLFGGPDPYTLVKFPEVGQDRADQLAAELAARNAVPDGVPDLDTVGA